MICAREDGMQSALMESNFATAHVGVQLRSLGCMTLPGWTLAGQDQCIAPAAYGGTLYSCIHTAVIIMVWTVHCSTTGACKRVSSFSGMTLAEKQQIAEECKAPWSLLTC